MLKNPPNILLKSLHVLFNLVLKTGIFPKIWNQSHLVLIHKKGDIYDPGNYRGISVTSNLGKLFNKVIFNRLVKFIEEKNLISQNQIGFKQKSRTSDHLFTLNTITNNKKIKHKKVFSAFIDLRKAFDTVWRTGLFYKILKDNFPHHISKILISMYTDTHYRIKFEDGVSHISSSERGVKQGDVLSPLLFNYFINDLVKELSHPNMDPVVIENNSYNILLYADDIVLLSETDSGLQNCLNRLHSYCESWKLEVNIDKSKVIVFNSNGKTYKDIFQYNNETLETITHYNYLGICIKYNGNFSLAINALVDKGRKAYFKIKKTIGLNNPCRLLEKLFDSLVSPILLYCSEVWGTNMLFKNGNNPIEKFQNKFIKEILGVNCKATNATCQAELSRIPMQSKINFSIISFFHHIISEKDTLVYQIFKDTKQSNTWTKQVQKLFNSIGYSYLFNIQNDNSALKSSLPQIKERIKDQFLQQQNSDIAKNSKMSFYLGVYIMGKRPSYVDHLINLTDRSMICRLRVSSHQLMIEKGRHLNISLNDRICPLCKKCIEDEYHFLLYCNSYENNRTAFLNKIKSYNKQFHKMTDLSKIKFLLNNNKTNILKMSSNFISECLEIRNTRFS